LLAVARTCTPTRPVPSEAEGSLLDVPSALDVLPELSLQGAVESALATQGQAAGEHRRLDIGGRRCQANGRAPAGRNRTTSGRPKCLISLNRYNQGIVELLLARRADPNITDNKGKTPLTFTTEGGYKGLVELLKQHGAKE
jgi:hypothetical protein